jgi:hypothetical protein
VCRDKLNQAEAAESHDNQSAEGDSNCASLLHHNSSSSVWLLAVSIYLSDLLFSVGN